eukprot:jgi/Psemu1/66200/estExt_Genemark1.C_1850066
MTVGLVHASVDLLGGPQVPSRMNAEKQFYGTCVRSELWFRSLLRNTIVVEIFCAITGRMDEIYAERMNSHHLVSSVYETTLRPTRMDVNTLQKVACDTVVASHIQHSNEGGCNPPTLLWSRTTIQNGSLKIPKAHAGCCSNERIQWLIADVQQNTDFNSS